VAALLEHGESVRAVDRKPAADWFQLHDGAENLTMDLSRREDCLSAVRGSGRVYNFASDMGGMGFVENNKAACMLSVLINTHLLEAARESEVEGYFFASSACVYPIGRQDSAEVKPLRESDAYPAEPEDGYGWEKLFSERMCRHFREDFGLPTRVARFHNVYGPNGAFDGGREKAPAAICRKIAQAKLASERRIEVWGDGKQTRTFTYIDDCVHGTRAIMESDIAEPLNVGSTELVTIDHLIDLVEEIAGFEVKRDYDLDAPQGVRGRSSDNTRILAEMGWEPATGLKDGLERTYRWIFEQVSARVPASG
jgi:nucleoside-diphosphate-sugar epimerase